MAESRINTRFLIPFLLGIILGSIGMFWCLNTFKKQPEVRFYGTTILDTASYENPYFNNAIYLGNPNTVVDKIYLRFRDDTVTNAAIGKRVIVSGYLKTLDIGDGERVTELDVLGVEHVKP